MDQLLSRSLDQAMKVRTKRILLVTMVATSASTLCSYTHFRNHSFFSRNGSDEKNWFSNLVAKRFKSIKSPSLPETTINQMLRANEHATNSLNKQMPGIVSGFETNHYRANRELEDRHCECRLNFNNSYLFGVFDGHSGRHCSESLKTRLPVYMSLALMNKELRKKFTDKELTEKDVLEYLGLRSPDEYDNEPIPGLEEKQQRFMTGVNFLVDSLDGNEKLGNEEHVEETIQHTYLTLDKDIAMEAIPDGICNEPIWAGLSGAVAITAYIKDKDLYVSNTGDCRAVLGSRTTDGQWTSEALSFDHNSDNIADAKRLKNEHPKEKLVIYQDRLLGQLQPLRAFGDVPYKWTHELHRDVLDILYDGYPCVPKSIYLTPPYLTAEPEVTHKKLNRNTRFLILATDGLWDTVSNEKAVKIIGEYLDGLKNNIDQGENGATKLIRYALGRGKKTHLSYMLSLRENEKRDYHDDITVTVIYFDDEGGVTLESKL